VTAHSSLERRIQQGLDSAHEAKSSISEPFQAKEEGKERVYKPLTQLVRPLLFKKKLHAEIKPLPSREGGGTETKVGMSG